MKRHLWAVFFCGLFFMGLVSSGAAADGGELYSRCVRCHGEDGTKKADHVLKGQKPDALVAKLKGYADGSYGGANKAVMQKVAAGLSEAEMQAVAAHIGTFLPPVK